jgi:hypothetical protein
MIRKLKNWKIEILAIIIIIFIVFSVILLNFLDIQQCINEKQKIYLPGDYVSGAIIVSFDKNLSYNDAKKMINNYGLEIMREHNNNVYSIAVKPGTELFWICEFEKKEIVRYSETMKLLDIPKL